MITIVTGNNKKFAEMKEALGVHRIEVTRQQVEIDEIQELEPEKVIRAKALAAFEKIGSAVLVDDSGITFESFPKFPGTYSKFAYKALGFQGLYKLIHPGEKATFTCSVGFMEKGMHEPQIFWGTYEGTMQEPPATDSGTEEMPYALIFQPTGESKPMAEMTTQERTQDHRHKALNAFAAWYTIR